MTSILPNRNSWNPYDVKASWVAVFLLLLLWWLTYIPLALFPRRKERTEDGILISGDADEDTRNGRLRRLHRHFRDGLLFLLTSTALDTVANGPYGATNALTWIFTSIWLILALLKYFTKWDRLITILSFLDLVLVVGIISNAFAHEANPLAG